MTTDPREGLLGLKAEDLTPVYDWKAFVRALVGDNPLSCTDDGWCSCFFCEGEGGWAPDEVDHEEGCVWIEARYALAVDDGTLE